MYGKFFSSAFTGSMFGAGPEVFAVWAYVVSHAVNSIVELNPKLLAVAIGTTPEKVSQVIDLLCAPDPLSRNKAEDGRRLLPERGFQYFVVSHDLYRGIRNEEERRDYNRIKKAESRVGLTNRVRGYVYYAKSEFGIKIGYSANPWARVDELRVSSPSIKLLATEPGTMADEKNRHSQFSKYRIEREWFRDNEELSELIAELATATVATSNNSITTKATMATSAHTEAETYTKTKAKNSPRAARKAPDPRHSEFRKVMEKAWSVKNKTPMQWDASEAKQLSLLLGSLPELTTEQFTSLLRNRHRSEVNHAERPRVWLPRVTDYANGPIDRFGKPMNGKDSSKPAIPDAHQEILERNRLAMEKKIREDAAYGKHA